jgi:hypothetical protein
VSCKKKKKMEHKIHHCRLKFKIKTEEMKGHGGICLYKGRKFLIPRPDWATETLSQKQKRKAEENTESHES